MHCDVATGQGLSFIAGLDHNWNLRDDADGLTITNYRCRPAVSKEMQKLIFYYLHRDML